MFAFCSFCRLSKSNCLHLSSSSSSPIYFQAIFSSPRPSSLLPLSFQALPLSKSVINIASMSNLFYFLSFVWVCIGCLRMGLTMRLMETRLLLLLWALFVFQVACTHRSAPRVHLAFKGERKHYSLPVYAYSNTQLLSFSFAYAHIVVRPHMYTLSLNEAVPDFYCCCIKLVICRML